MLNRNQNLFKNSSSMILRSSNYSKWKCNSISRFFPAKVFNLHARYATIFFTLLLFSYKIVASTISPSSYYSKRIARSRSPSSKPGSLYNSLVYNNSKIHVLALPNYFNQSNAKFSSPTFQITSFSPTRLPSFSQKPFPTTKIPIKLSSSSFPTTQPTTTVLRSDATKTNRMQPSKKVLTSAKSSREEIYSTAALQPTGKPAYQQQGNGVAATRSPTIRPTNLQKPKKTSSQRSWTPFVNIPTTALPTSRPLKATTVFPILQPTKSKSPSASPSLAPSLISSTWKPSNIPTTIKPRGSACPTVIPSTTYSTAPRRRPTQSPTIVSATNSSANLLPKRRPSQNPTIVPTAADDIQYRGGLVYTGAMKIVNIFYGNFSGEGVQSVALTNYLAANLGTSAWYNQLRSYYKMANGTKVYVSGQLTFAGSYNLFPTWRKNNITVTSIAEALKSKLFNTNVLKPDPNTIYAVIFRGDFSVSGFSGSWLRDWCGIHTGFTFPRDANYYPMLVMGDLSSVDPAYQYACSTDSPYPNGNLAADSVANSYVQEVIDTITDPVRGTGWTFNPGNDRYGDVWEVGDECAWIFPSGYCQVGAKNFSLPKMWLPGKGCTVPSPGWKPPSTVLPTGRPSIAVTTPPILPPPTTAKSNSPSASPSLAPSTIVPTPYPVQSSSPSAATTLKPSTMPSGISDDVKYQRNGNNVMTGTVNLYHIYFGKFDNPFDKSYSENMMYWMDYFAEFFNTLPWFPVLSQYYQIENGIQTFASNRTRFVSRVLYQERIAYRFVNDNDMQTSITKLISEQKLPVDPNGIYVIIFRGEFKYGSESNNHRDDWLIDWCGYHSYFAFNSSTVLLKYVVIGDPATAPPDLAGKCISINQDYPSTIRNLGADSMITTYAHEIAEAITDPYGDAWNSGPYDGEIADKCNLNFGIYDERTNSNTRIGKNNVLVQQIFQRGVGCVMRANNDANPITVQKNYIAANDAYPVQLPTVAPNLRFDISYHAGGAVMVAGVTLVNIFIGSFSTQTVDLVNYFSMNIGGSSWYNVLTSYYQLDSSGRKTFVSSAVSFNKSSTTMLMSTKRAAVLTDLDIQQAIIQAIVASHTTVPNPNAIYTVMFRGDFNVSYGGKHWLVDWCSYHATLTLAGGYIIRYAVIGDPSTVAQGQNGAVCEPIYGIKGSQSNGGNPRATANGDLGGDSILVSYGQQLANIVTDFEGAWYSDLDGSEPGSACWRQGGPVTATWNVQLKEKRFLMPQLWQPGRGCTLVKL